MIGQLHALENEIASLRIREYNDWMTGLKLDELMPPPKHIGEPAIAKVDNITVKTFNTKEAKEQAKKRWTKALNVITASTKLNKNYENARIKRAEEILQNPIAGQ